MTLQATGAISIDNVATELAVSHTGLGLGSPNVRSLAGKASGAISLSNLYSKQGISPVNAYDGTVNQTVNSPGHATARVTFTSDGLVTPGFAGTGAGYSTDMTSAHWYVSQTANIGSNYWARATVNRGTILGDQTGVWLHLTNGANWWSDALTSAAGDSATDNAQIYVEIAASAGGAILAFGTISLFAAALSAF